MKPYQAVFRFYEELNDFLPADKKKKDVVYQFDNNPSIKDPIEALGIPHTEVELIIVNGNSVGFDYKLQRNDRVAVYPMFESFNVTPVIKLREKPLRDSKFILDVHLGKLARILRMLGFDCLYQNDYEDPQIVQLAVKDKRIILTHDRKLLQHRVITHGYWIRSADPYEQVKEVLKRFDLFSNINQMKRCLECNNLLKKIEKEKIMNRLEPLTKKYYNEFYICSACDKIYWPGSHYLHMQKTIQKLQKTPL